MEKSNIVDEQQRFSIRKLTVGAASVLVGTTLFMTNIGNTVHADNLPENTEDGNNETTQENIAQPEVQNDNKQIQANNKKANNALAVNSQDNNQAKADAQTPAKAVNKQAKPAENTPIKKPAEIVSAEKNIKKVSAAINKANADQNKKPNIANKIEKADTAYENTLNIKGKKAIDPKTLTEDKTTANSDFKHDTKAVNTVTENVSPKLHFDTGLQANVSFDWNKEMNQNFDTSVFDSNGSTNVTKGATHDVDGEVLRATYTLTSGDNYYQENDNSLKIKIAKVVHVFSDLKSKYNNHHGIANGVRALGVWVDNSDHSHANYYQLFGMNANTFGCADSVIESAEYYDENGKRIEMPDVADVMHFTSLDANEYLSSHNGSYVYPDKNDGHWANKDHTSVTNEEGFAVGGSNHGLEFSTTRGEYWLHGNTHSTWNQWGFDPNYSTSQLDFNYLQNREYTRTINIVDDNGNKLADPIVQTLQWNGTSNSTDGFTMHEADNQNLAAITLPKLNGYRQGNLSADELVQLGAKTVNKNVANSDIYTITYHKLVHNNYQFVDDNNNAAAVGSSIATNDGINGETVNAPKMTVPNNYKLADGQALPANTVTLGDTDQTINIHLVHDVKSVTSGNIPIAGKTKTGQTVTDKDLTQTIKRTITANIPDHKGGTTTQDLSQTVTITRNASYDPVTNIITLGNWSTGHFNAVNAPSVSGYTADLKTIPAIDATAGFTDPKRVINYTANPQSIIYKFVDANENGQQVGSIITVNGVTDQTVNTNLKTPDNYELAKGNNLPSSYTFKANGNDPITIHLVHKLAPNITPDEIPSGAQKTDENGQKSTVTAQDFNKTITRKITLVKPDHKGGTINDNSLDQTLSFTRTGTYDPVTKIMTFGNWTSKDLNKKDFSAITVPKVDGYSASVNNLGSITLDNDAIENWDEAKRDVTVTYTANPQSIIYKFVDDNENGQQVGSIITVNGATDQIVNTNLKTPDNYELAKGNNLPSSYTFKANGNDPVTIHLIHKLAPNVTPDKIPSGAQKTDKNGQKSAVTAQDFDKTITRKITLVKPDHKGGTINDNSLDQTLSFTRIGTYDPVTKIMTFGNWTSKDPNKKDFNAITVPKVDGYSASVNNLDGIMLDNDAIENWDEAKRDTTVTYTANPQQVIVQFVDDNPQNKQDLTSDSVTFTGTTDSKADFSKYANLTDYNHALINYQLAKGQNLPTNYIFKADNNSPIVVHVTHKQQDVTSDPSQKDQVQHTISRTITINLPKEKAQIIPQSVTLKRSATKDLATGQISYGNWSKGQFNSVNIPSVAGYTMQGIKQQNVPAMAVDINTQDKQNINITYLAQDQHFNIVYQDNNGKQIAASKVNGKTDENVKLNYNSNLPTHWKIDNQTALPQAVTLKATNNQDVIVKISHIIDTLPDQIKKISRKVTIIQPDGTKIPHNQTVDFTRTHKFDEVTKQDIYGNWDKPNYTFSEITIPAVAGYTASGSIPKMIIHASDFKDASPEASSFEITYKANGQNFNVIYQDTDENNKAVETNAEKGKTDETIQLDYAKELPQHYEIVAGQNLPQSVKLKANNNQDIIVKVRHILAPQKDDSRIITRKVIITNPDGKVTPITQQVTFNRSTALDTVINKTLYGTQARGHDWQTKNDTFAEVNIPVIAGYTPNRSVNKEKIAPDSYHDKNYTEEIKISYIAGAQSSSYQFIDDDENGIKVGNAQQFAGKTDQTVNLHINVPAHYVANGNVPKQYTFKANNNQPLIIHLKHIKIQGKQIDPNYVDPDTKQNLAKETKHAVKRIITTTQPNGHQTIVKQTEHFTRNATVDQVTGKVTYDKWQGQNWQFNEIDPDSIAGYTTLIDGKKNNQIKQIPITNEMINNNAVISQTVNYKANPQTVNWSIIDDDNNGKVIASGKLSGVTDQTIKTEINVPSHLQTETKVPSDYKFTTDNKAIAIHVHHEKATSASPKQIDKSAIDPDTGKKVIDEAQVAVSRMITIVNPETNKKTIATQSAIITRSATKDNYTGKWSFGKWNYGQNKDHGEFSSIKADKIPGYISPRISIVAFKLDQNGQITSYDPKTNKSASLAPADYYYTARNDSKQTIQYVDDSGKPVGNNNGKQVIIGTTAKAITFKVAIDNWHAVKADKGLTINQNGTITLNKMPGQDTKAPLQIVLSHNIEKGSDKDHLPQDSQIVDNHGKHGYKVRGDDGQIHFIGQDDFNKLFDKYISRVIEFDLPTGIKTAKQTAHFKRGYHYDAADKIFTFDAWQADSKYDTSAKFANSAFRMAPEASIELPALEAPSAKNYLPTFNKNVLKLANGKYMIDGVKVTPETQDINLKMAIKYIPSQISGGDLIDPNNPAKGRKPLLPDKDGNIPGTKIPFPDELKPENLKKNTTREITETINITKPDQTKQSFVNHVNFNRNYTIMIAKDGKSAKVVYGKWTSPKPQFDDFTIPAIQDYDSLIDGKIVKIIKGAKVSPDSPNIVYNVTYAFNADALARRVSEEMKAREASENSNNLNDKHETKQNTDFTINEPDFNAIKQADLAKPSVVTEDKLNKHNKFARKHIKSPSYIKKIKGLLDDNRQRQAVRSSANNLNSKTAVKADTNANDRSFSSMTNKTNLANANNENSNSNTLPQTGEYAEIDEILAGIGVGISALGLVEASLKKRKHD